MLWISLGHDVVAKNDNIILFYPLLSRINFKSDWFIFSDNLNSHNFPANNPALSPVSSKPTEPMTSPSSPPRVFISYSHDSDEHRVNILDLADRLRASGILCHIDQYELNPPEKWPQWMLNQVEESDFVLITCTEQYDRRFNGKEELGKGKGVTWEGGIITQELYDSQGQNNKFIPIILHSEDVNFIPITLRGTQYYRLYQTDGFNLLYRRLTNQHDTPAPPLGPRVDMPVRDRRYQVPPSETENS